MGHKHTPGPWELHVGDDYITIFNGELDVLPDTLWDVGDEQALADARLMAAAPDLLATLEGIAAEIRWLRGGTGNTRQGAAWQRIAAVDRQRVEALEARAAAAIAQAKGA